jgi:hypothetical protein
MSCLAAMMRASSVRPINLGTINAAMMPMMTTTTMISIRVKPRAAVPVSFRPETEMEFEFCIEIGFLE